MTEQAETKVCASPDCRVVFPRKPKTPPSRWKITRYCSAHEIEEWRPIPRFPGYEASDLGGIRSVDRQVSAPDGRYSRHVRGVILSQNANHRGYMIVSIGSANTVHRLVLEAFVGPRPEGMEACHNNGDPSDARLINLRWDTKSANMADKLIHGTNYQVNQVTCPRGHRLAEPNLVAAVRRNNGRRNCLACGRARSYMRNVLGVRPSANPERFQAVSDAYYVEIVGPQYSVPEPPKCCMFCGRVYPRARNRSPRSHRTSKFCSHSCSAKYRCAAASVERVTA